MRNLQYLYWLSLPDTQQHLHGRHCTRSNMHQTTTTHARRSSLVIVRPNVSNPNPDRTTTLLGLHTLLGRIHARQRALHAPPRCARLRAVTEDAILTLLRAVTGAPAPLALAAAVAPARRRPVHAPPRLLPAPLLSVAEHPVTACNGGTGLASLVNACFCTVTEQTVVAVTVLQAVVAHHFLLGTQFRCTRDTSRRTPTRDLVTHLRAVTENAVITRDGVARFARPLRAHLLSIAEQSILAVGGAGTDEARVLPAKPHTHHRLSALHSAELDQDLAVGCRVDVVLARAQRRHDGRRLQPIPHHCRHLVGVLLCLGVGARLLVVAHVQVQLVAGRDANHDRVVGATAPSRVLSMPDHAPTRLGGRVRHRGLAADEPLEGEVLGRVEAHERGVAAVVAEPHHPALVAVQELRVARVVQVEVVPDLVHLRRQRRAPVVVVHGHAVPEIRVCDPRFGGVWRQAKDDVVESPERSKQVGGRRNRSRGHLVPVDSCNVLVDGDFRDSIDDVVSACFAKDQLVVGACGVLACDGGGISVVPEHAVGQLGC
mmetsp:Transcript_2909/g.5843  ORF Transcript_2909/g.5843 Transcript_2909/m.5843 type:complete len:543 (-) Transcript_2909:496-2124(-)